MATFKTCVRTQRKDGYYPVYIRIVHRTAPDYFKTDKMVDSKGLTKNKDVKDLFVVKYCTDKITEYINRLNHVDISTWTVKRVKEYLLSGDEDIFERYMTDENDEYLLNFYKRHITTDSFRANANIGIKKICESMGLPKEDWYCVYTFRHTWGTVAQNDCGVSVADVAFGMNHAARHNVTRGYLKIDYSLAWVLNQKVVDFIFYR